MSKLLLAPAFFAVVLPVATLAQSRGGAAAPHAGGASALPVTHAPTAMAGGGAVHTGAAAGHPGGPNLGANHYVYARNASGQLVLRRASSMNGGARSKIVATNPHAGMSATHRRNGLSNSQDVPGLGFDYSHLAATHPGGEHGRRNRERSFDDGAIFFPYGGGGYFVPTGPDVTAGEGGDDGTVAAEEDQPEGQGGPADYRPTRGRSLDRPSSVDYGPPAPQPDVPEYVFVRRDGTVFFAVAYSWEHGSLKYVSTEGLRKTIARDTLDLNATQQFNEQRGMTFRAPVA
jgi:hypothetical protein